MGGRDEKGRDRVGTYPAEGKSKGSRGRNGGLEEESQEGIGNA
jgi:hypothetical protein